jgi:hypothetical protein
MNKSQLVAYRTGLHSASLYRSSESRVRAGVVQHPRPGPDDGLTT